ncbi:hypothetical protein [Thermococcus sp. JdF3]|uniref:hypothetical protein n=1 Tax=Thermococcus sp. JdF3 TaxID=1638258 RepID=UPI00143B2EDA|nr:hypothetical protein [Thermococcus sp. JdF3]NJE00311.1 hypothetical protein [Thermococcus sp. JdF3]
MTTLEDVIPLIERGYYEEALDKIEKLNDPLDKVDAMTQMAITIHSKGGPADWIPTIIDDATYIVQKMDNPTDRAMGYSMIASALGRMEYHDEAADFFNSAIEELDGVKDTTEKGIALAFLAYHMALSGYSEQALEVFNLAFDSTINAEMAYRLKVDCLLKIAELLEKAGDSVPSSRALKFYEMSFDIFDKLNVNQQAAIVEKKIELTKTVYDVGLPQIRRALLEGKNHYALAILDRNYSGVVRLIGALEIALWMKRVNNPEYLDVVDKAFESCQNPHFTEANVQQIAKLLTALGSLKRALAFAIKIKDIRKKSEAMKAIAIELALNEDVDSAEKLAINIPDPQVREEALIEIETLRGGKL